MNRDQKFPIGFYRIAARCSSKENGNPFPHLDFSMAFFGLS
jgi:hypothetical protein